MHLLHLGILSVVFHYRLVDDALRVVIVLRGPHNLYLVFQAPLVILQVSRILVRVFLVFLVDIVRVLLYHTQQVGVHLDIFVMEVQLPPHNI